MSYWDKVNGTDGTEQGARFPEPLRDDYFHVDEMSFEDLLSLTAKYSASLRFFSADKARGLKRGEPLLAAVDGDWSDLFSSDEAVIMAGILSTNMKHLRATLLQRLDSGAHDTGAFVFELAQLIDGWFRRLGRIDQPSASALQRAMGEVIRQRLSAELLQLSYYFDRVHDGRHPAGWNRDVLDDVWNEIHHEPIAVPERTSVRFRVWEKTFLNTTADSFLHSIGYLKSIVPQYMEESLKSGEHNPGIALLMGFFKLYRRAQDSVNTLTARHLDFYYRDVLKMIPRESEPDSAWVVLRADATARSAFVPKGTPFAAGKDVGDKEIIFQSSDSLYVTDAQVRSLHTLCLERDRLISPEKELGYVTRARVHQFETIGGRDSAWPIFGGEMKETCQGTAEDAQIGFAIASPVLYLKEGVRTLVVDLDLSDRTASYATASLLVNNLAAAYGSLSDADITSALKEIFSRYLKGQTDLYAAVSPKVLDENAATMAKQVAIEPLKKLLKEGAADRLYDVFLLELLQLTVDIDRFFVVFGRIFRRNLLDRAGVKKRLSDEDKERILSKAKALLTGTASEISIGQIRELLGDSRDVVFSRLLRRAFNITLSSAGGWHEVGTYSISPSPAGEHFGDFGIRCMMHLHADVEPIVPCVPAIHGHQWETSLPIIRFHINPVSVFYHYSLLDGLHLREATLECYVQGVKTFLAYNNEGQLDPSKPFVPFGSLPSLNSYLIVGQMEMARKHVYDVKLNVEWGALPTDFGGFHDYYHGYEPPLDNDSFQVAVSALRDGEWQPADRDKRTRLKLFEAREGDLVSETRMLPLDAATYLKPVPPSIPDTEFSYDLKARSGFLRLTLVDPDGAFGHKTHSLLLTRILTENARSKRPKPLPNAPYTPLISRMTIDYSAKDVVGGAVDTAAGSLGQKVYQIHPFGIRSVFPAGPGTIPQLLPSYPCDGNLLIGIDGTDFQGPLSFFFHMAEDSTRDLYDPEAQTPIVWSYLTSNRWRHLDPARVLLDTTRGFLNSGIVTLDLPHDINKDNTVMPSDLFWVSVGTSGALETFSSLYSVYTHGLKVTRQLSESGFSGNHVPEGGIRQLRALIPGVSDVQQISASFGGRMSETPTRMKTRVSERLRHKNRATIPWDYERLVLEEFPDVFKVKCLPNVVETSRRPMPGNVMIVVVPSVRADSLSPRFDAVELGRIQTFVESVASPCVKVHVRNPAYEKIQIRCAVRFRFSDAPGLQVNRLNSEIVRFLSPWDNTGYKARFGWRIRSEDVQSFILSLDFVEFVTDFSILHLTDDGHGNYRLADTARFLPLTMGSFRDFRKFVVTVLDARDPIARLLLQQLSPSTMDRLKDWKQTEISFELAEAILDDMNAAMTGSLLDPRQFVNVALKDDTKRRLQLPGEPDRVALNRSLLEDWGVGMIETCAARTQEIRPEYPWSLAIPMSNHWIETLDKRNVVTAQPTGIAELEIVSNFIIS